MMTHYASKDRKRDDSIDDKYKFWSRETLVDHWMNSCEAFYFFCPTCNKQYKVGKHNCNQQLREEKKSLSETIQILKDEDKRLIAEFQRLDRGGLEIIKREHSNEFNDSLMEFYLNYFIWMDEAD